MELNEVSGEIKKEKKNAKKCMVMSRKRKDGKCATYPR